MAGDLKVAQSAALLQAVAAQATVAPAVAGPEVAGQEVAGQASLPTAQAGSWAFTP